MTASQLGNKAGSRRWFSSLRIVEGSLWRIHGDLLQMTARQRRALFRKVLALNTTNCSWVSYRAREFLLGMLIDTANKRQRINFRKELKRAERADG